ncbi:MAG: PIG-L deacetylase family protein [Rickettsiales bacterium]
MKNILVIAAHPDDEILGCGATMAKLAAGGANINIAIMAEGITARDIERNQQNRQNEIENLANIANESAKIVGANSIDLFSFPDNRMDSVDLLDIVKKIEELIEKYKPDTIFTHNATDVNIDHQIINQAVITATRPTPDQCVKTILSFEVASSTEWKTPYQFPANWFIDVSEFIIKKLDALKLYESEMRPFPHPRSLEAIEALAKWRGATIGVNYAEAFILERHLHK